MESVAVIGTGIAGMSCAANLYAHTDLTVFEKCPKSGGHTNTVDLPFGTPSTPVDTGFMVYNEATYPLLTRLFSELKVETMKTEMSFGVNHVPGKIEFCGSSLNGLFANRSNLANPSFWKMLFDVVRFNKLANAHLGDENVPNQSLGDFIRCNHFSTAFLDYYLLPMTSAIWSTPPDQMLNFPAATLIRFMYNHGLLGFTTQHQWRTVVGGSRQYRDKLISPFKDKIFTDTPVRSVIQSNGYLEVQTDDDRRQRFDKVVIATHADTALEMLANPTCQQKRLLSAFPYSSNKITLHSDEKVMPRSKRAWAAWNYRMDDIGNDRLHASTHYWMNRLQKLPTEKEVFVSVNDPGHIEGEKIFREFTFEHPTFDLESARAQPELPQLNTNGQIYFCGAYFRYGFHEDGLMSGYAAANALLNRSNNHEFVTV